MAAGLDGDLVPWGLTCCSSEARSRVRGPSLPPGGPRGTEGVRCAGAPTAPRSLPGAPRAPPQPPRLTNPGAPRAAGVEQGGRGRGSDLGPLGWSCAGRNSSSFLGSWDALLPPTRPVSLVTSAPCTNAGNLKGKSENAPSSQAAVLLLSLNVNALGMCKGLKRRRSLQSPDFPFAAVRGAPGSIAFAGPLCCPLLGGLELTSCQTIPGD